MRGQCQAPVAFYPRERPSTLCIGGWVGPKAGLDRCVKSRPPTGIRSPDRQARSQSLYRLSYPGPLVNEKRPQKSYSIVALESFKCFSATFLTSQRTQSAFIVRTNRVSVHRTKLNSLLFLSGLKENPNVSTHFSIKIPNTKSRLFVR